MPSFGAAIVLAIAVSSWGQHALAQQTVTVDGEIWGALVSRAGPAEDFRTPSGCKELAGIRMYHPVAELAAIHELYGMLRTNFIQGQRNRVGIKQLEFTLSSATVKLAACGWKSEEEGESYSDIPIERLASLVEMYYGILAKAGGEIPKILERLCRCPNPQAGITKVVLNPEEMTGRIFYWGSWVRLAPHS